MKSIKLSVKSKPSKPHKDYPLFAHASGRWAKKVRGKLCYFGPWRDSQGALAKWLEQKDDLLAGRSPRVSGEGLTIRDLLNRFLTAKQSLVDTKEISQRHFEDLYATCERIKSQFGLTRLVTDLAAEDFEAFRSTLAKTRGATALGTEITRTRIVFKYGFDSGLIDRPVRYGQGFRRPSKRIMRQVRQAKGLQMFEADEIHKLLAVAGPQLQAMILLATNTGFGNADIGTLPLSALDLDSGWVRYPRPKTAVDRRCPLWAETIAAITSYLAKRTTPQDYSHCDLVFITKYGGSWSKNTRDNPLAAETKKLMTTAGITRDGLAFYGFRRTFETIAGDSLDQVAVDFIMGHAPSSNDMSAIYRQRITDDRLRKVVEHVRTWLFGETKEERAARNQSDHIGRSRVATSALG